MCSSQPKMDFDELIDREYSFLSLDLSRDSCEPLQVQIGGGFEEHADRSKLVHRQERDQFPRLIHRHEDAEDDREDRGDEEHHRNRAVRLFRREEHLRLVQPRHKKDQRVEDRPRDREEPPRRCERRPNEARIVRGEAPARHDRRCRPHQLRPHDPDQGVCDPMLHRNAFLSCVCHSVCGGARDMRDLWMFHIPAAATLTDTVQDKP